MKAQEFLETPLKSITLIGMSGCGKTHFSQKLGSWGWTHYSCDEQIGTVFLGSIIARTLGLDNKVTKSNLEPLSRFIGKLGNPAKGGLDLAEFKRRQTLYIDAECDALRAIKTFKNNTHFVNDSTGSLCEIEDQSLLKDIGSQTVFVYIKTSEAEEKLVLQRAHTHPKPLYFPPALFDGWLSGYRAEKNITDIALLEPDDFSRWVFPRLLQARLPKYQALADQYGVTIPSSILQALDSEDDFIRVIAKALESR